MTRHQITSRAHHAKILEQCRMRTKVKHRMGESGPLSKAAFARKLDLTVAAYEMMLSGHAEVPESVEANARRIGKIPVVQEWVFSVSN